MACLPTLGTVCVSVVMVVYVLRRYYVLVATVDRSVEWDCIGEMLGEMRVHGDSTWPHGHSDVSHGSGNHTSNTWIVCVSVAVVGEPLWSTERNE